MSKDFHSKVFDDGTQIKLYIFREYLKKWLPVFLASTKHKWDKLFIYDFFAGTGSDAIGNSGSPLIALEELKAYCKRIKESGTEVKVVFNEISQEKSLKLQDLCAAKLKDCKSNTESVTYCPNHNTDGCSFNLVIENKDFEVFFKEIYAHMIRLPQLPRFMFLDQFGVKYITEETFQKIIQLERTDFIFFISSSFVRRFAGLPEFQKYLKLSNQDFNEDRPHHCHRIIFKYYKSLIPTEQSFYLAPFSIKKNQNIYGLIFGTHHSLGIEKFLNVCWAINNLTGDANYDIDEERIHSDTPKLFPEFNIPNKIQFFETELKSKIKSEDLTTNLEIYKFAFDSGMLPKHANKVIEELKRDGKINKDFKTASQNIHKLTPSKIL